MLVRRIFLSSIVALHEFIARVLFVVVMLRAFRHVVVGEYLRPISYAQFIGVYHWFHLEIFLVIVAVSFSAFLNGKARRFLVVSRKLVKPTQIRAGSYTLVIRPRFMELFSEISTGVILCFVGLYMFSPQSVSSALLALAIFLLFFLFFYYKPFARGRRIFEITLMNGCFGVFLSVSAYLFIDAGAKLELHLLFLHVMSGRMLMQNLRRIFTLDSYIRIKK